MDYVQWNGSMWYVLSTSQKDAQKQNAIAFKYSNGKHGFHFGKDFLLSSFFLWFLKYILEIIFIDSVSDIEVQGDVLIHIYFKNEILFV